jgi:hypothetical protein
MPLLLRALGLCGRLVVGRCTRSIAIPRAGACIWSTATCRRDEPGHRLLRRRIACLGPSRRAIQVSRNRSCSSATAPLDQPEWPASRQTIGRKMEAHRLFGGPSLARGRARRDAHFGRADPSRLACRLWSTPRGKPREARISHGAAFLRRWRVTIADTPSRALPAWWNV